MWEPIIEGICYAKSREFDSDIYMARIDLNNPNLKVLPAFTSTPGSFDTLSNGANRMGAVIAINASFFLGSRTVGPVVADGQLIHPDNFPQQVIMLHTDGSIHIHPSDGALAEDPTTMHFALSGSHALVTDGVVTSDFGPDNENGVLYKRHPRTAVGIDKNGFFYMVVIDGRRPPASQGVTMPELAGFIGRLGVEDAVNLDGGGSAEMVALGGVVNKPSDGEERRISIMVGVVPRT